MPTPDASLLLAQDPEAIRTIRYKKGPSSKNIKT